MNISIITLFPDLYIPFLDTSLVKKAHQKGIVSINTANLFNYCTAKQRIDGATFGPGAGVVIKPEIIEQAIDDNEIKKGEAFKIFFSPSGRKLNQTLLVDISIKIQTKKHLMLLPARYEGMDYRVEKYYADEIISIGDYVLMGGDLPAMVFLEGILRLIPGVIGKKESVQEDSFSGAFVDYPQYTEPISWKGEKVPEILRSGDHQKIKNWREDQAVKETVENHFQWLRTHIHDKEDVKKALKYIPPHYAVIMHDQVVLPGAQEGTSSVTSIDIHDIGRSARTYGIKKYFIVTPLIDQQKIVKKLMEFWQTQVGIDYNPHRHEALSNVVLCSNLDEVINIIKEENKNDPILIATTARSKENLNKRITYWDQDKVFKERKPILFIFGTAQGLSAKLIDKSDFILEPIEGFSNFNHLSVRSAAAIIFDRWIGINNIKLI